MIQKERQELRIFLKSTGKRYGYRLIVLAVYIPAIEYILHKRSS